MHSFACLTHRWKHGGAFWPCLVTSHITISQEDECPNEVLNEVYLQNFFRDECKTLFGLQKSLDSPKVFGAKLKSPPVWF